MDAEPARATTPRRPDLESLDLAGGRLVAALDTDDGGALIRVVTADGERVHLWAPRADGHLEAAGAGGADDLGPLEVGEVVDGEVRLAGPFGWLSVPWVERVDRLERWRGPTSIPATDDPTAEHDPGRADAVQVLEQPEIEIRVMRTAGDGTTEVLLAATGGDAVAVASVDGVEGDAVLFASRDLTLRLVEITGLLAHPTVPAPPPVAADGAHLVTVVITRSEPDGAIAGGYLRWIDDGPTGWLRVVVGIEERDGELVVSATRRRVPSVVDELLGYVAGGPEEPAGSGPPG